MAAGSNARQASDTENQHIMVVGVESGLEEGGRSSEEYWGGVPRGLSRSGPQESLLIGDTGRLVRYMVAVPCA